MFPTLTQHVFVCTNRRPDGAVKGCCASKGSEELHAYMKARAKELGIKNTRINKSGCLDACESGIALVIYPEGKWHTIRAKEDVDVILNQLLTAGANPTN
jgi:(2Fe-2S) ferredoxin